MIDLAEVLIASHKYEIHQNEVPNKLQIKRILFNWMSRSRGMRYIPSVFLPKSSSTWTDPELPAAMCQWGKALLHSANATYARSLGFDNSACFYIVLVMVGLTIRDIAPRPNILYMYNLWETLITPWFWDSLWAPKHCKTWPRLVHTAHRRSKKGPLLCIGQSLRQGKRGADHWCFAKGIQLKAV